MPLRLVFLRNVDRYGRVGFGVCLGGGTMSKERELLERALEAWNATSWESAMELRMKEIRAYLAEPEKKLEPLSAEEVNKYLEDIPINSDARVWFKCGIRFAEAHHGIGGEG